MLKNTLIKINADKSITANFPYKIYQGEINTHKFIIDPSLVINDTSNVVGFIGFKRADNQKSGFVPLKKEQDGTFTYVIKDYWTLNLVGKVWYTIRFSRIDGYNKLEYQLYAGNSSFPVNPLADYILGDDIPPDTATDLQNQIDNLQEQINTNESNIDSKLNKEFNTYPKLDWDNVENSDIVSLNRINLDGTVTQYYAEAKDLYNSVNYIRPDEEGNIELTGEDIKVSSTNNNTIDEELDLKVNSSEPLVYYQDSSLPIQEPMISIYRSEIADRAIADGNDNNIVNTYATKTEVTNSINNLNNSLSQDISDTQTLITNLSNSVSQNYATKNELTNGLNDKQDNLTSGTGIQISNDVISCTVEGVKSELVYSGDLNSQTSVNFQTSPTFTPKHFLIEYAYNSKYGSVILTSGNTATLDFSELIDASSGYMNIQFDSIYINVTNSTCKAWRWTDMLTYENGSYSRTDKQYNSVYIKVYAINI